MARKKYAACDKTCPVCGKVFKCTSPYQVTKQVFCSRKCRTAEHGNGRGVEMVHLNCATCGKDIVTWPCLGDTKRYCSVACRAANKDWKAARCGPNSYTWSGGNDVYWKRQCRERDSGKCRRCGREVTGKAFHAHHIVPVAHGGTDDLVNLIGLCNVCHPKTEWDFYNRLLASVSLEVLESIRDSIQSEYNGSLRDNLLVAESPKENVDG